MTTAAIEYAHTLPNKHSHIPPLVYSTHKTVVSTSACFARNHPIEMSEKSGVGDGFKQPFSTPFPNTRSFALCHKSIPNEKRNGKGSPLTCTLICRHILVRGEAHVRGRFIPKRSISVDANPTDDDARLPACHSFPSFRRGVLIFRVNRFRTELNASFASLSN